MNEELIAALRQHYGTPEPPKAPAGPVPTLDQIRPGISAEELTAVREQIRFLYHQHLNGG